ncbi:fibronectin type-III domain-containing protein 3A isoform X2 [Condylostylus longicornis]|uniref:fibronectin type-III domain-containing protein 3A isoform X2 n=1 Tax=Condylostylus longicornis TaxID=2530218 RepID=UPI00244DFD23|nr:fibronectin type-III domain-containing protein 3A isoform X2 [Condylostylus longicornis]
MVSQNRPPPIPVPVQVPQGQVMQQYVNDGTLTHVVLSPSQYQQLQQLHAGQGGVPHLHHQYITNGTTSHATYYSPIPTGFPGPGGGPHYHPIQSGHLQPQQMSHSPSPPNNYHNKDDRTQRQHAKLLRKLNNREMNSAMSTPAHSPSPRKELNGRRISRNGASSVGTSEDGEESSSVPDDEDDCQTIIEQLSAVQKPEVTDITSRSAMLRWEAPPLSDAILNSRDLRYDVLLSDRGKEGKYKLIFKGESYVCMIQDLRPGQEYHCRLQVHYEKLQGTVSEPAAFTTPPCEPDQPLPPKLIARTKNSLQLRWLAPCENGSHIAQYILEADDCKGKGFMEVVRTKGKQYTLTKLQPSTLYNFRLSAVNECGPSMYSDVIAFSTSVNLPSTPKPPQLLASNSNYLRLAWEHRQTDETFCLQMNDHSSGHGYLTAYNGPDTIYECSNLKRATVYHFKLRAENEAGSSPWSNEIAYKTQPDRPGRPSKPQVKGKIHGNYFKAKWDPPNDRGGADIRKYFLEISSGAKFQQIYNGSEPEAICDRLSPGTTYQIRVCCEGPGGVSNYSDVCTVTTEAIQPGAPDPPYCDNVPGPFAAVLRWNPPDYNGGAPILEYEIKLTGLPNFCDEIIYRGKDMYCICTDLRPGESYEANVRAVNRIGAGSWSGPLKFKSGAAPPNQPDAPEISVRSPTHLSLTWKEPASNGAPIIEYRLESSLTEDTKNNSFTACYQGLQTTADIRNLVPYTLYYFRLNAANLAGQSLYSQIVSQQTPAAVPTAPEITKSEITATEVTLTWSEAESNGSEILYYQIEYVIVNSSSINSNNNNNNNNNSNSSNNNSSSNNINNNNNNLIKNGGNSNDNSTERFISTEINCTEFTIENLLPETTYKFKIQAVNDIGIGQWSAPLKLTTLPPPPEPPKLECTGVGHNFIKLKWGEGRNLDFINYYVEMYNNRLKDFQIVYNGTTLMCKVNKLQEQTAYTFRICAETDRAGTGDYSEEYVFKTSATLPNGIKAPRIAADTMPNDIRTAIATSSTTNILGGAGGNTTIGIFHPLTIEWQHSKNSFVDPVEYILQCSTTGKENDYVEIHRGPDTRYTIDYLDPGSVYLFRVAPVRVTPNGDIQGSFTYPLRYQVPHKLTQDQLDSIHHHHHHHHNQQQQHHNTNLINRAASTSILSGTNNTELNRYGAYNYNSNQQHNINGHKSNSSSGGILSGFLSSVSNSVVGGSSNSSGSGTNNNNNMNIGNNGNNAILANDGNLLLHNNSNNNNNMLMSGNNNGGTNSDLINNDELFGINIFGAIRRFINKCYTLYTNPKHFSDTQQAIFWMFSFLLITFIFAYLLRMFMR